MFSLRDDSFIIEEDIGISGISRKYCWKTTIRREKNPAYCNKFEQEGKES